MYHTTPPPNPLTIQGAHFEFREPMPLPASETFIPNPKDRKQPEFYKFGVFKNGEKVGFLTINKKSEWLKPINKAVFTPSVPTRQTETPQIVFWLDNFDIPIDAKQMLNSAYHLERDKKIATKYCLDFEQQYIDFVSSQFGRIAQLLPIAEFKVPTKESQDEFLAECKAQGLSGVVKIG